ncbi:MAG: GIY-YIG nuclease family protein [Polynucleobacter sp.]
MGCIYKATNTVNGKAYIGQTIHSLAWRKMRHNDQVTRGDQTPLHRALRKYGKHSFKWEYLVDNIEDRDQLDKLEAEYIFWHDTMSPRGYNLQTGGKGCRHSEETIKKMKESHKGKHLEYNYVHTITQLIQYARVKQEHGNIKACTPRDSKRMANGCNKRNRYRSANSIRCTSKYNKQREASAYKRAQRLKNREEWIKNRKPNPIRPVVCVNTGMQFKCIADAAKEHELYGTDISKVCKDKQHTVHGYVFKYI